MTYFKPDITTIKPLTPDETTQLLMLLRKLWKYGNDQQIVSIAKSLFSLITRKLYEAEETE
ncbi:MAG: hypothetical protein AAB875_01185 [Patescibacteria group bacterium]